MNQSRILIAPSILAADFSRLAEEVRSAESAGADWLHLDVMDGHFVPNLSFGPDLVEAVRKVTRLPLDVHLMIEAPERTVREYAARGADSLTVHVEALLPVSRRVWRGRGWSVVRTAGNGRRLSRNLARLGETVRRSGCRLGLAVNPATPVALLEKGSPPLAGGVDLILVMSVWPGFGGQKFLRDALPRLRRARSLAAPGCFVQVDGGVSPATVGPCVRAGATVIVAGTSVFGLPDRARAVRDLRKAALASLGAEGRKQ